MQDLKQNYFGNDKWAEVGLKLGLLQQTLDVIKADSVDAKGGPNLTTLATVLKDMGYTAAHDNIVSDTIKMCYKITFILLFYLD